MTTDLIGAVLGIAFVAIVALIVLAANDTLPKGTDPTAPQMLYSSATGVGSGGPLVAHALALAAQPDFIERAADGAVRIVTLRVGLAPAAISREDALTLAAQALVVDEALGVATSVALLRYQDRDLALPMTPALRDLVHQRIDTIRAHEAQGPIVQRQDATVCRACAYRAMCPIGKMNAPAPHSVLS